MSSMRPPYHLQATIVWAYRIEEPVRCGENGAPACVTEVLGRYTGEGEFASGPLEIPAGRLRIAARYEGEDNFLVWLIMEDRSRELIFNKIGSIDRVEELEMEEPETVSLRVDAGEGAWTVEVSVTY